MVKPSKNKPNKLNLIVSLLTLVPAEVKAFNKALTLTAREFDLLLFLAKHPQQVFSRMQLLEAVWGYNYDGYEHTVNSHINRLRNKLSQCSPEHDLVKTVWGVGYKFSPPEVQTHQ
ncbi:winged helix-turn-helix domain-containing protein [Paucibacter sp. O1-1]|nr:winged helix-turn-helix domain-containing protein [Paucibacter sp. O1-1]MDA3830852.1 winged helix-turn-helix domain-containing protein [Paucibacter sp. O1-1]